MKFFITSACSSATNSTNFFTRNGWHRKISMCTSWTFICVKDKNKCQLLQIPSFKELNNNNNNDLLFTCVSTKAEAKKCAVPATNQRHPSARRNTRNRLSKSEKWHMQLVFSFFCVRMCLCLWLRYADGFIHTLGVSVFSLS